MKRNIIVALGLSAALTGFVSAGTRTLATTEVRVAKNGADDPRGDVKGEGPKHPKSLTV